MTVFKVQHPAKADGLLNDFFNDLPAFGKRFGMASPMVNISEKNENYSLDVFAPGRSKEDFTISVDKNLLTISALQKETKEEQAKVIRNEFNYGSFKRTFTLDEKIAADQIVARYENGILNVTLPKKEVVVTTKQIEIQ